MRTPIIAGNWKMNNTVSQGLELIEALKPLVKDANCEVVVCPTAVSLDAVVKATADSNIAVGAQNMHFEENGAFTGEIAPSMLAELGVKYVVLGHSERRTYFGETDEALNKKLKKAFEHKLIPILCIGETLEEREGNITEEVLGKQIKIDLAGLEEAQVSEMVIAYEPIWAIGTGRTATSEQANETIAFCRKTVESMFGGEVAEKIRIQYGGSVKPDTIKEQMTQPHIDGGLIGGASLNAKDFAAIVNFDK
jgi:triosephosphate isomerase